jgi:hypothetical protein
VAVRRVPVSQNQLKLGAHPPTKTACARLCLRNARRAGLTPPLLRCAGARIDSFDRKSLNSARAKNGALCAVPRRGAFGVVLTHAFLRLR